MMKKFFGLMALLLIFGCDDGDMTFQSFDFSGSSPQTCNDGQLYKVNGSEVLVLDIDEAAFQNVVTPIGTPRIVTVSGTNSITYLKYAEDLGNGANNIVCEALPSASPVEIWNANGGTIAIQTVANTDEGIITGYTHTITLLDLSFERNGETIIITDNDFGSYQTTLAYEFAFNDEDLSILPCANDPGKLYIVRGDEILEMVLDQAALFQDAETPDNAPRTATITQNNPLTQLKLYIYNGNASSANVCLGNQISPQLVGLWRAVEGTIEVTTEAGENSTFTHTIKLVNVKFVNNSNVTETFTRTNYVLPAYTPGP